MKNAEIKQLSLAELEKKVRENRTELLNLRLRKTTGQVEKPHLLRSLRREIARLQTFARQKRAAAPAA